VRAIAVAVALLAAVTLAGPASAQQAKCLAGKTKCMAKAGTGLIKCEQLAETPGKPADPNAGGCRDKVLGKFDGGIDPTKGCFEKLESKMPTDCITFDDTTSAESAVASCVGSFVSAIDPAAPPPTPSKCDAGKKKCVAKLLAGILKCRMLAQTPGKPTDPNTGGCVDKAVAKYTGGVDPTKGCVVKLDAANPNDCQVTGDSTALENLVNDCAANLVAVETATTSTSTSTTTTSTLHVGVVLLGALTATPGRFNYNATVGLPGANAACNSSFPGTHACTYAELQTAEGDGDLVGLKDVSNTTVNSFWAIDGSAPPLQQCNDDAPIIGSGLNWEYATAHTASRGNKVALTNGTGTLGALQVSVQCNLSGTSNVGCCQ
jgi:hypothetical protein